VVEYRGLNWRLPELNAALARSQLTRLSENICTRRMIAGQYDAAFAGKVQTVPHASGSARHLYQLLVDDRPRWQAHLKAHGIGTAVHYPLWMAEPPFRHLGYQPGMLPNAEWHSSHTLSIPLFPTMTEHEIARVIQAVLACV
jgi:dTDP-4-amino-4,6-dideoxygalactose transaminase